MEGVNLQTARFRLFRSRAFWFGVPGLVFLLWAWGDSGRYVTNVFAVKGQWYCVLSIEVGCVKIQSTQRDGSGPSSLRGSRNPRRPVVEKLFPKPPPWGRQPHWHHHVQGPGWVGVSHYNTERLSSDVVTLPYWFLLLLYAVPWWGVVLCRWRWMRRLDSLPRMPAE